MSSIIFILDFSATGRYKGAMKAHEKLTRLVKRKGLSNREFAGLIGTSEAMASRLLSGKRRPSPALAAIIESKLNKAIRFRELLLG